ncbi:TetR/AcrR family transcriptional regulator [Zymomonas mobilis]|nr:TetR/AcrR family transcriptional regulator [Zymomonas mobilis]
MEIMNISKQYKGTDRREAILEEAKRFFLEKGYAETSMSAIAAKVGGSKGTLWSHFPSKEALFRAVIERLAGEFHKVYTDLLNPQAEIEITLNQYGCHFCRNIIEPDKRALFRLAIVECWRFPEVGKIFYEAGPQTAMRKLASYFASAMEKKQIRQEDPEYAASFFLHSLSARSIASRLYNIPQENLANKEEIEADVSQIVSLFLKAYAP